ncbi:hypothetical protein BGX29_008786 [Mortierella sp. GBA35]|nr:hypothetical protein BGX29_008786 [Mortierella sp. GBA35]
MVYKTTPSTTLFLHSSRDYRSINHEDHNEVSGHNYSDPDNDWILRRAPSFSSFDTAAAATAASQSHCEGQLLRWKDVVWLEHVDTGRYLCSMAGYKNGQGFQEVCVGEEGYDGDHEWVVEETPWVRQHILGDE